MLDSIAALQEHQAQIEEVEVSEAVPATSVYYIQNVKDNASKKPNWNSKNDATYDLGSELHVDAQNHHEQQQQQ